MRSYTCPERRQYDYDLVREIAKDNPGLPCARLAERYTAACGQAISKDRVWKILTDAGRYRIPKPRPVVTAQTVRAARLRWLAEEMRPLVERGRFALSDHERDRLAALLDEWINLRERPFFQHGAVTLNYSSEFREVYWAKSPYAATAERGE